MNEQVMSSMSDLDIIPIGPLKGFAAPQAIDKLESILRGLIFDLNYSFMHTVQNE